jgi:hypothetical protein
MDPPLATALATDLIHQSHEQGSDERGERPDHPDSQEPADQNKPPPLLTINCSLYFSERVGGRLEVELSNFSIELRNMFPGLEIEIPEEIDKRGEIGAWDDVRVVTTPGERYKYLNREGLSVDGIGCECLLAGVKPWYVEQMVRKRSESTFYLYVLYAQILHQKRRMKLT